jgi:hypothetical protein
MSILLPDLPAAVRAAVSSVTSSVSTPVADIPAAISPTEEFTFSVTVNNTAANNIRLVNVRYHLSISPTANAALKVPATPPARASADNTAPVLAVGTFVSGLFLFPTDNSLDVGDSDTITGLKGKALALGSATITCHIHADPDVDFLFPKNNGGQLGSKTINIV